MKRRSFFTALPVVALSTSIPVLASPHSISPRERLEAAIVELKAAATEVYPNIETWTLGMGQANECPIVIAGLGRKNPHPEPLLADDVTGMNAYAEWDAWEQANA